MNHPTPVFAGFVDRDGKLQLDDRPAFLIYAKQFTGQDVSLTIKRKHYSRSLRANAYYWGVVVETLADFCGYDAEDMHEALAMKFLRDPDDPILGVPRRKRTPTLSTAEFADYVDQCLRLAAELGVVIPSADQIEVSA